MVVDLLSGKKRFATLMDDIQPMVVSQFIVWLDEKVAEFKCQGCMNLEINFEAPKWIKDYSMSMLVSGAGLTDSPSRDSQEKESNQYSHSRHTPVSPQPPRRTQGAVTPLVAARRLHSQGSHSPAVSERMRDMQMSSQRKRAARESESPDLELIEVKKERLEEDLYVVEESSSHRVRAAKGTPRSTSLQYEAVADILDAVSAGSSAVSISDVIPSSSISTLATEPLVSYRYASPQSRKTVPSSDRSSLHAPNASSDTRLIPYSASSGTDEETDVQSGLEMSVDSAEQSGYSFAGDDTQQITYPGFDGDHDSENGGDSSHTSGFTDIKPVFSHSPSGDSADTADPLSQMQLMKAGPSSAYSETDEQEDSLSRYVMRMYEPSELNLLTKKLFVCKVCGKRYSDNDNLRQHQRVVHEGQQYECEICGKRFNSRQTRHRHKKLEHQLYQFS